MMKTKRKIVYCLPSLYIPGGMERVLCTKANYFADVLGYEVYIILTDEKEKAPYYPTSSKIHLIHLDINFNELWDKPLYKKIFIYLKKQQIYKQKLKQKLLEIRPDFTVSMLRREINFITKIEDGSIKIGEIHVNRENIREIAEGSNSHLVNRILSKCWMFQLTRKLKKLSRFVILTHEDSKKWKGLNNTTVIPNPLPFFPEGYSTCETKTVIAVGRHTWQKGFDRLIDCWNIVHQKHPDWKLHIYGDGEREKLQQQIDQLALNNCCILKYPVANIMDKYIESSIFALSSRNEGFGMVIIEAMSCGVPAVSFKCPCGPNDIIRDEVDGILVEKDNVKQLAHKICYLIENEPVRKKMGQMARLHVERYKMEHIAREWENLFDSLTPFKKAQ